MVISRREVLVGTAGLVATSSASSNTLVSKAPATRSNSAIRVSATQPAISQRETERAFNGSYEGEYLDQIAFPMGGRWHGLFRGEWCLH